MKDNTRLSDRVPKSDERRKTAGQQAYDNDCGRFPFYANGQNRPTWENLSEIARWSWERNPTPR